MAAAVGGLEPRPRRAYAREGKFLVIHARHRRSQLAEDLLTAALTLKLFGGHAFWRTGAVQRLERTHQRVEMRVLGLALLFADDAEFGFHSSS